MRREVWKKREIKSMQNKVTKKEKQFKTKHNTLGEQIAEIFRHLQKTKGNFSCYFFNNVLTPLVSYYVNILLLLLLLAYFYLDSNYFSNSKCGRDIFINCLTFMMLWINYAICSFLCLCLCIISNDVFFECCFFFACETYRLFVYSMDVWVSS